MTVIAGCLNVNSEGAQKLNKLSQENINGRNNLYTIELNLERPESIKSVVNYFLDFKTKEPDHSTYNILSWFIKLLFFFKSTTCFVELYALVNNAGVMVMGEFEWLTDGIIDKQIDVNLRGTIKMTKAFIPYIRQDRGRIVTVTSHCGIQSLPGMAVYGATKAGLQNWMKGLRFEMDEFNVKVIDFIPGKKCH